MSKESSITSFTISCYFISKVALAKEEIHANEKLPGSYIEMT